MHRLGYNYMRSKFPLVAHISLACKTIGFQIFQNWGEKENQAPQPLCGWCCDAKTHRLHLWLFTFNPFGVGASGAHFPQVAPVAIHIQPLRGWHFDKVSTFIRYNQKK